MKTVYTLVVKHFQQQSEMDEGIPGHGVFGW